MSNTRSIIKSCKQIAQCQSAQVPKNTLPGPDMGLSTTQNGMTLSSVIHSKEAIKGLAKIQFRRAHTLVFSQIKPDQDETLEENKKGGRGRVVPCGEEDVRSCKSIKFDTQRNDIFVYSQGSEPKMFKSKLKLGRSADKTQLDCCCIF